MPLIDEMGIHRLTCNNCGKSVSSGYLPLPTDTPDKGLVIRAYIECPECIGARNESVPEPPTKFPPNRELKG